MSLHTHFPLPATIGSPEAFAVRIDLDQDFAGEWLLGRVCYLIGGNQIGDFELGTSLRDVLLQMHFVFKDCGKRRNARFDGKSKDELRDLIDSALRGTSAFYDIAKAEMWARHEITPPVDVFDGIHVLQFDKASESHLIWYSTSGNAAATTHELMLPCGTVDCVLRQLRELLEAMLQFIEET